MFIVLHNHRHYLYSRDVFVIPTQTLCPLNKGSPLPQPLATSVLLCVRVNLPTLRTSCKWNHTIFVFL